MITVEGKNGIKATVLAYSISPEGVPFITYELEYPRLILAELNTHRALSRNSFSSRAVPFNKMLEQLSGKPVRFGANQGGMQDKGEDYNERVRSWDFGGPEGSSWTPEDAWDFAKLEATKMAKAFYEAGYHKQVYNRLLEPFQMMKTVLSATELENFWWLRDDLMADPTLAELARVMREAMAQSKPVRLLPGMWHLPYVDAEYDYDNDGNPVEQQFLIYQEVEGFGKAGYYISIDDAIKLSCARCAAVSYRNEGYGLEKSRELYDRLVGSDKKHASALEHCATPMVAQATHMGDGRMVNVAYCEETWEEGVTHMDRKGQLWSGNLRGWVQHRKTIPGENYEGGV